MYKNPAPGPLRYICWICDRLKRQPSVSSHQAVIEGGEGCVSFSSLHIAPSSYIRIMILFNLPITIFICIDYRENLVDCLAFSASLIHTHTHTRNAFVSCYNIDDKIWRTLLSGKRGSHYQSCVTLSLNTRL